MKFTQILGALAMFSMAFAGPITRDTDMTNSTAGDSGSNNESRLRVFVVGTGFQMEDGKSNTTEWEVSHLTNKTITPLNITDLFSIAPIINETLSSDNWYGVVLITFAKNIEELGLFSSVLFNTDKPIVISTNVYAGIAVAQDEDARGRGPLVIDEDSGLIYPTLFSSYSPLANSVIGYADDNVAWFTEPSRSYLVDNNSTIKSNYSNFTNHHVHNNSPVVPIIYEGEFSDGLMTSVTSSLDGLVVVTSAWNNVNSTIVSNSIPVVYAPASIAIPYLGDDDVPEGAVASGYLTPIQAQTLLSIAIANKVTEVNDIINLFP